MHKTDEYERLKKFKPHKNDVVGITPIIPREDTDEKFEFYDIQGESVYSNPPPRGTPTIDHGMDEDHIWAFHRTLFNQEVVKNTWADPKYASGKLSFAPFWGEKLTMPAWYKRDKMDTF